MFQPTPSQSALVLFLIIGLPVLIAWLGLLVQCANASFKSDGDKVAWVLILILLGPIGAALYLIGGRSRQIRSASQDKWVV
jgi:uncharacterized membrane protein